MVLRDMERVCTLCIRKAECHRHLAAGRAAEHYRSYCPNATTIEQLCESAAA
jgi:hypothetical protein